MRENQTQRIQDQDVVFGRWPVKEALEGGPVAKVMLARGSHGDVIDQIVELAKKSKVPFRWVDRRELDRLVGEGNHQGVAALTSPFPLTELDVLLEAAKSANCHGPSLLFLDGVQDPHNVGSLIRTAVFFGVAGVVFPKWRSASLTGTIMRTSAGGARHIHLCQVSNLATTLRRAKEEGFWLVGADMTGQSMKTVDVPKPLALVVGGEGEGLHRLARELCDFVVSIPGSPNKKGIDSLNVGVAGGILLSHFS